MPANAADRRWRTPWLYLAGGVLWVMAIVRNDLHRYLRLGLFTRRHLDASRSSPLMAGDIACSCGRVYYRVDVWIARIRKAEDSHD